MNAGQTASHIAHSCRPRLVAYDALRLCRLPVSVFVASPSLQVVGRDCQDAPRKRLLHETTAARYNKDPYRQRLLSANAVAWPRQLLAGPPTLAPGPRDAPCRQSRALDAEQTCDYHRPGLWRCGWLEKEAGNRTASIDKGLHCCCRCRRHCRQQRRGDGDDRDL